MSYILYSHSILLPNFKFKRWKLLSQRMRTSRMNGIGVDSQVQMKSGCEKTFLPSLKTSAFFSIDVIRWYYVIDHTSIKVRKYQKQIILFSFQKWMNYFLTSSLATKAELFHACFWKIWELKLNCKKGLFWMFTKHRIVIHPAATVALIVWRFYVKEKKTYYNLEPLISKKIRQ